MMILLLLQHLTGDDTQLNKLVYPTADVTPMISRSESK